ncbi:MAG TPA: carboxylating nicotinate-nucleotide diphosphorylase [Spirochaetia bacterium]|nr:carboxylating nicotinate-nucleotide diphosphorylase [Spirochaetia bacterium]
MLSDNDILKLALYEDLQTGDITTDAVISKNHQSIALLYAKEEGILCGQNYFETVFSFFNDPFFSIEWYKKEGDYLQNKDKIASIKGLTGTILKGERTALNILQHLSGIASRTKKITEILSRTQIKVLDTRKTLPLLRNMEKKAVKTGGGENHRFGLYDRFLIKENHIKAAGSIFKAVAACAAARKQELIEVETTTYQEVLEALETEADIIMLDNMSFEEIEKCCLKIRNVSHKKIEVSGNMNEEKIKILKNFKIDFISMGALIHSVKALDLSLLIESIESGEEKNGRK